MSENVKINLHQPILTYHPNLKRFIQVIDEETGKPLELFHILYRCLSRPALKLVKKPDQEVKGETVELFDVDTTVDAMTLEQRALLAQELHFKYLANEYVELDDDQQDDIKDLLSKRYYSRMEIIAQVISAFKGQNQYYVKYLEEEKLKPITNYEFNETEFMKSLENAKEKYRISEREIFMQYVRALWFIEPEHPLIVNFIKEYEETVNPKLQGI
jgi:hypothetical protein